MPRVVSSGVASTSRAQLALTERGIIAETTLPSSGTIPTANAASGTLVLALLGLRTGDVVTNLHCCVTVAGTGLTFAKLGLFDFGGRFRRATASASATFNSGTGFRSLALTSPYTATSDDGYYVGFLQYGSGATGATLVRGTNQTPFGGQIGSGVRLFADVAAQTDLATDVTLADGSACYWFAVS